VIDTGDNLAHPGAVPYALDALGPLLDRPGAFVLGSNDYWAPRPKNPLRYLVQNERRSTARRCPGGTCATGWPPPGGPTSPMPEPAYAPPGSTSSSSASTTRTSAATGTTWWRARRTPPPT
jgi:hypothetical protein